MLSLALRVNTILEYRGSCDYELLIYDTHIPRYLTIMNRIVCLIYTIIMIPSAYDNEVSYTIMRLRFTISSALYSTFRYLYTIMRYLSIVTIYSY